MRGVKLGLKFSLTLKLGTNGLKVTSEPPPMAGQAGCFQGQDRSAVTNPRRSHARRCLIRLGRKNAKRGAAGPRPLCLWLLVIPCNCLQLPSPPTRPARTSPPPHSLSGALSLHDLKDFPTSLSLLSSIALSSTYTSSEPIKNKFRKKFLILFNALTAMPPSISAGSSSPSLIARRKNIPR
ncbi:hypothetical protein J6590_003642 [Homalodisca vitripennis]|nr:hypothetical protein J6590_003642 [Homalodisca vitripennis]